MTLPESVRALPTKMRLGLALRQIGLDDLAAEAERGMFDDYESPIAFPLINLVHRLGEAATLDAAALAERVKDGEFDGTKEESDAWARKEGWMP
jgi:hypothetical protein